MVKEVEFLFTVPAWMPCWGSGEHEPLIISLFLLIFSCRNWKGPWTIHGSYWGSGAVWASELECKREWEKPGPIQMEGNLQQVLEEVSERCRDILRKTLCRARAIPSIPDGMMRWLLR